MAHSKESLIKLLNLVSQIAFEHGNEWFRQAIVENISIINPFEKSETRNLSEIKNDTSKIVNYLSVNPDCSIDYDFIDHKLLKTRLELDNLRMENVRYDLSEKDEMKRLYDFCVNAFYQIENLINYFYFEKFPKINDLLTHLEQIEDTNFKRKTEKNISDITIATKIFAFTKTYFRDSSELHTSMNINSLRLIRNEGLHRCTRIKNFENENSALHKFIKHATFDSIHSVLNYLTIKIKTELKK